MDAVELWAGILFGAALVFPPVGALVVGSGLAGWAATRRLVNSSARVLRAVRSRLHQWNRAVGFWGI